MTIEAATAYIRKHHAGKILATKLVGDDGSDYIPVNIAAAVVVELLKKKKEPRPKLLYFGMFVATWQQWYALHPGNKGQKPTVNENPSEKAALWGIMKQLQAVYQERGIEYTEEAAKATFMIMLQATQTHSFLRDKQLSLHLMNKFFNDLVVRGMATLPAAEKYDFSHITKP